MKPATFRLYTVVNSSERFEERTFFDIYTSQDPNGLHAFVAGEFPLLQPISIERPSLAWPLEVATGPHSSARVPELVLTMVVPAEILGELRPELIAQLNAAPAIASADHWCPVSPAQTLFGTRAKARRLIGAAALGRPPYSGRGVNVVVVDEGLNKGWIDARYGPGRYRDWPVPDPPVQPLLRVPGQTSVEDAQHGLMLVRNILDIAPEANIYDLPMLPPRISNINAFLDQAQAAFIWMKTAINATAEKTWVLVNSWAIYDRSTECPLGDYTENIVRPPRLLHKFTESIADAIDQGLDVVFCAGNCGQFCPDARCGGNDRGVGHSIWGANSYHRVLTVGAVRVDGTWIGYSSQGPGQPRLGPSNVSGINRKPDLCLPSGFAEDFDMHTPNRGTSAATGIAAGVVAGLRSNWDSQTVPPETLLRVLRTTARQPVGGDAWNPRLGNGILDVPAALAVLE